MSGKTDLLIDPNFKVRLKALESVEDEQRWQRYLAGCQTIPFENVRSKLHGMAAEVAKFEPECV